MFFSVCQHHQEIWSFPFYNGPATTARFNGSRQAMNFFTKPAMSYGEFKQQCISLRWSWWEIGMMRMECLEWWNAWCFDKFLGCGKIFWKYLKKKLWKKLLSFFFGMEVVDGFFKEMFIKLVCWFGPDVGDIKKNHLVINWCCQRIEGLLCNISCDCLDLTPSTQVNPRMQSWQRFSIWDPGA